MKHRFTIPLLAALAVASTPALAEKPTGEEQLAKMLEGREAGEPQRCIMAAPVQSMKIIDGTAIVYESGNTLYVNYTQNPKDLDDNDYLVVRRHGMELCRTDIVTLRSQGGNFYAGNVFLTDFIPYKRVKSDD